MRRTDIIEEEFRRGSRYTSQCNSWYFKTREGDLLGPYSTPEKAVEGVEIYIALMNLHEVDDRFVA